MLLTQFLVFSRFGSVFGEKKARKIKNLRAFPKVAHQARR
jgi:hypothetical protein